MIYNSTFSEIRTLNINTITKLRLNTKATIFVYLSIFTPEFLHTMKFMIALKDNETKGANFYKKKWEDVNKDVKHLVSHSEFEI